MLISFNIKSCLPIFFSVLSRSLKHNALPHIAGIMCGKLIPNIMHFRSLWEMYGNEGKHGAGEHWPIGHEAARLMDLEPELLIDFFGRGRWNFLTSGNHANSTIK